MNALSKYLVAGGIAAAAAVLSYRQQSGRPYFPWMSSITNCKESSVPIHPRTTVTASHLESESNGGDLYCFYCGKGGDGVSGAEGNGERGQSRLLEESMISERPDVVSAISRSRRVLKSVMLEQGVPGGMVAVMMDGKCVWSEGVGLADVENDTPCTSQSGLIHICR